MGDSCFYGEDAMRPDPPFPRTKLSNIYLKKKGLTLCVNNIPVPTQDLGKYRLFPHDVVVGDYPFTWHHNVPWNLLRTSWDLVVTFCGADCVRRLFNFYVRGHPKEQEVQQNHLLDKILNLQERAAPTTATSGERSVGSKTMAEWVEAVDRDMKAATEPNIAFLDTDRDDLRVILCWGAWNLNEGPGVRIDDPDEQFDDFGRFDAHARLDARYVSVARLNSTLLAMRQEFEKFASVSSSHTVTCTPWSNALAETLNVCEALTPDQRQISYFDPMMWAPVTPSGRGLEQEFPKKFDMRSGLVMVERGGVKCYIQMKKKVRPGSLR